MTVCRILLALLLAVAGAAASAQERHLLGPGDTLSVSIYDRPELSGEVPVRGDGSVALHLLGRFEAAGRTAEDLQADISERAEEVFEGPASVLVGVLEHRPVFVTGAVEEPGAYPWRPGLTVIKAVALAGGLARPGGVEDTGERRADELRRRATLAQSRLAFLEAQQAALADELERSGTAPDAAGEVARRDAEDTEQDALMALRRELLERSVEGAEQREALAEEEAQLFSQRRGLIARQLAATAERLSDVEGLVERGLARQEQFLNLQVDVDEFRTDELEAAAFEARARQTAANAESEMEVAQAEYRQELLADKIDADQEIALARAELRAALSSLREVTVEVGPEDELTIVPVFEVYRDGADRPEAVGVTAPLRPDDVLTVRLEAAGQ